MSYYQNRKHPRLQGYDYGQAGAYFVTICTHDRRPLLGHVCVGRDDLGAPLASVILSSLGHIVRQRLDSIPTAYPMASLEHSVIMPNHIHLLLIIHSSEWRAGSSRPTQLLPRIVSAFKRLTNEDAGQNLWQTGYHDHIVRNDDDHLRIWQYIDDNPSRWAEDRYFTQ